MNQRTRFTIGLHILVSLTLSDDRMKSGDLAWSINADPSKVRRILSALARQGLVTTRSGAEGGSRLAKDAASITLLEVLDAVALKPSLNVHVPNPKCPLGATIAGPLTEILNDAEQASREVLRQRTVSMVAEDSRNRIIERRSGSRQEAS